MIAAILALEEALQEAPAVARGVSGLIGLLKRAASGGADPTAEEIAIARNQSKDAIARIQADIDAG